VADRLDAEFEGVVDALLLGHTHVGVGLDIGRAVALVADRQHGNIAVAEPVGQLVTERQLHVQRVATVAGGVDDKQDRVGQMFDRAGGLSLDVVALVLGAVEQPRRVDQLVANPVAVDVADLDATRGKGVLGDLVRGAGDVVDKGGFADVRVAGDHDGRLVGLDVWKGLEFVAGVADRPEIVLDLVHDVGDTGEGLLAVFARGLGLGLAELRLVFATQLLDLAAGPRDLRERLPEFVDVDDGVGEFVVEGVDILEIRPRGDDVFEVVGGDVDRDGQHRLLGLEAALGVARPGSPREGLVEELLRPGSCGEILENHLADTSGDAVKARSFGRQSPISTGVTGVRHQVVRRRPNIPR